MRVQRQTGIGLVEPYIRAYGVCSGLECLAEVIRRLTLSALERGEKGLIRGIESIGLRIDACLVLLAGYGALGLRQSFVQRVKLRLRHPCLRGAHIRTVGGDAGIRFRLFHGGYYGLQLIIIDRRRSRARLLLRRFGYGGKIDGKRQRHGPVHAQQSREFHTIVEYICAGAILQPQSQAGDAALPRGRAVGGGIGLAVAGRGEDIRVGAAADLLKSEHRVRDRHGKGQRTVGSERDGRVIVHGLGGSLGLIAALTQRVISVCHIGRHAGKLGIQLAGNHKIRRDCVGLLRRGSNCRNEPKHQGAYQQQTQQFFLH